MEPNGTTYPLPIVAKATGLPGYQILSWGKRDIIRMEHPKPGRGRNHPYTQTDLLRLAIMRELCDLGITAEIAGEMASDVDFTDIEPAGILGITGRLRSGDEHIDQMLQGIPKGMAVFGEDRGRKWNGRVVKLQGMGDSGYSASTAPVVTLPVRKIWADVEARLAEVS